jgi:hypothetical protein
VISGQILRRLAQDVLEQTCLCPTCLETVARLTRKYSDPERAVAEIHKTLEKEEPQRKKTTISSMEMSYSRPRIILKRGTCCGNGFLLSTFHGQKITVLNGELKST